MIVQAMEAFSIPIAAERSVKAKNKVLPYKAKSKTAPNNARKRFIFFISRILSLCSKRKLLPQVCQMFHIIYGNSEKIKYWLFEKNGKWYIIIRAE